MAERARDRVDRQFAAHGPNRLWVADITYIPTWSGFLYLAMVLDVWSRRIVGWAMATHLRTDILLEPHHNDPAIPYKKTQHAGVEITQVAHIDQTLAKRLGQRLPARIYQGEISASFGK